MLPLIALAGIFGIYTLYHIARHCWLLFLYEPIKKDNKND